MNIPREAYTRDAEEGENPRLNDQLDFDAAPVELDEADILQIQQAMDRLQGEERFLAAFLAAAAAAFLGAVLWAVVTVATGYQIGFMAVGVGFLIGFAVRQFGHGVSMRFGVLGAGLSLVGCLLGNVLTIVASISQHEGIAMTEILSLLTPEIVSELMVATFHPLDLLFYWLALYYGFKLSFRELTPELLDLPLPAES